METGPAHHLGQRRSEALGALLMAPGWLGLSMARLALTPDRSIFDLVTGSLAALLLTFTIYGWWRVDQQARDLSAPPPTPGREITDHVWPATLFGFLCLAPLSSHGPAVAKVAVSIILLALYAALLVHVRCQVKRSAKRL